MRRRGGRGRGWDWEGRGLSSSRLTERRGGTSCCTPVCRFSRPRLHVLTLFFYVAATGIFFSMPPGLGSPPLPTEVRTTLPSSLLPPPHLLPFFTTNILSRDLPSTILLQTLAMASDLEELGLFGSIHRPPPPVVVTEPTTHWNRTKQLVTEVLISLLGLCHPNSSPVAPEWPPVPLLANIKIPLSSLGQSKGLPVPQGEGGGGKGKRLSEEDIEWLKAVGKVQQVYL